MGSGFWKSDWFLGAIVVAAVLLFGGSSGLVSALERKAYDLGVNATLRAPSDRIAVIAIDDSSIDYLGRWPWPRDIHARMVDLLAGARAKVIASTLSFSDGQVDPGLRYIAKLLEITARSEPHSPELVALLREAERELNSDRKLAESAASAGNVLLPMLFRVETPLRRPDKPPPEYMLKSAIAMEGASQSLVVTSAVQLPPDSLGRAAAGLGHLNTPPDADGTVRREPLVVQYLDRYFPSMSMMVAAASLDLAPAHIRVRPGEGISLGRLRIGTDPAMRMYPHFYKDREGGPAFQADPFHEVLTGKIPASKYAGRIVLIGLTATAVGSTAVTPVSSAMAPVQVLAHSVSSILQEHFFVAPAWVHWTGIAVLAAIAAYVVVLLPRLASGRALVVTAALLAGLLGVHLILMISFGVWMQLMLPGSVLLAGHAALASKRFVVAERAKMHSGASADESNRMLGLAYQGQGQLDLAWDRLRQVRPSQALLDNLYGLALDFEGKRQFTKAEVVLRHIHGCDPRFRDVESRLSRARQLAQSAMRGGPAGHAGGSLPLGTGEKRKFGRFEVQKELGRGAMGAVYLGKDPKIGREVAIKTIALSQEFAPEELAQVKERFFREAETAGRLSHPNIVTIYDTGEEREFCYIAMELLKGSDLTHHLKPGKLLPMEKVVSMAARVADALAYAHRHGVVHRDVKPANIMYHAETDTLKVTDFGIARFTNSSRTRAGLVLGTPSYMSPEQLAGSKIDGRSDLFSLGVTLYQLLCGKLPFEGSSMAQTLFKIANEPPADIRSVNPAAPPALAAFLERALAKNPAERFETGEEFGGALRAAVLARVDIAELDISL